MKNVKYFILCENEVLGVGRAYGQKNKVVIFDTKKDAQIKVKELKSTQTKLDTVYNKTKFCICIY